MKIAVIGAGGFAREVAWLIRDISQSQAMAENSETLEFVGFLADKAGRYDDVAPLGDFSWLERNHVDALAMGIGDPATRLRLACELSKRFPELQWPALLHPSVMFDDSCTFGPGATVCAGNIFTVNVQIGAFALINLHCTIGHEAVIGDGVVINPLCAISGGVSIEKGALIGTHSSILQYVTVGENAIVGSGAMVNKNVPPGVTVVGVPARQR